MKESERLFETVEKLRSTMPALAELDPDLVREVLTAQVQMQEDRAEARRRTERAITRWAATHAGEKAG